MAGSARAPRDGRNRTAATLTNRQVFQLTLVALAIGLATYLMALPILTFSISLAGGWRQQPELFRAFFVAYRPVLELTRETGGADVFEEAERLGWEIRCRVHARDMNAAAELTGGCVKEWRCPPPPSSPTPGTR